MTQDYINYAEIMGSALRKVIRDVLLVVLRDGIQEEHNFFITFLTNSIGAQLSARMKAKYPEEITIQLQHQFSDLKVEEDFFSVRLSFGGISEVVVVPYKAVTLFEDRGASFALEFNMQDISTSFDNIEEDNAPQEITDSKEPIKNNIIVLDKFRKKKP